VGNGTGHEHMTVKSVRFSASAWALIRNEADRQGVSASQFLREAGLARAWFEIGKRGGEDAERAQQWLQAARAHESDAPLG
jgi:hypothetical protein